MIDPNDTELRQIKRILIGILVCVVVITLAVAPGLIAFALIVGAVGVIAMFGVAMMQTRAYHNPAIVVRNVINLAALTDWAIIIDCGIIRAICRLDRVR